MDDVDQWVKYYLAIVVPLMAAVYIGVLKLVYWMDGSYKEKYIDYSDPMPVLKPRLLILRTTASMVGLADEKTLCDEYSALVFCVKMGGAWTMVKNQLAMLLWLGMNMPRAFGVFFRFADYHAFLPALFCKVLRKKLWIVVGGYDAHWLPEYNYGVYASWLRAAIVRFALRSATTVLPVHESLWDGVNSYAFDEPRRGGMKHLVPRLRESAVRTLPNGFDVDYWRGNTNLKRPVVLTVASVPQFASLETRRNKCRMKGLTLIAAIASIMPDVLFVVVGTEEKDLPPDLLPLPTNVVMVGRLQRPVMLAWYRCAKVYAHPSLTEGMSNSIAEAMLCKCVPVVSNVDGNPDLVGNAGFILPKPLAAHWATAIRAALDGDLGDTARERIVDHFNAEDRRTELLQIVR